MKNPKRITVALDEEALDLLDEMDEEEDISKSELVRRAIRFYYGSKRLRKYGTEKLDSYLDLLSEGEHIVLDIDHWLLLLDVLESSSKKEEFWEKSKKVADSHADQLASEVKTLEDLLERLSTCNFFRLNKASEKEYTLLINSEKSKKFVQRLLKDFCNSMGFEVEIQEDIGKLRVKQINNK